MAKRTFQDCVNDPEHAFGAHPEDYTLFSHGHFDQSEGMFEVETMVSLGNGVSFKTQLELFKKQQLHGLEAVTEAQPQVIKK